MIPEEAKRLFLECFDSDEEEADIILGYAAEFGKIDTLYRNGEAVNMVCSTKIIDNDFRSDYIFAVCTKPNYRKQGFFRKQLDVLFGDSPVVLIPENESLIPFYLRLGFEPIYVTEADINGSGQAKEFTGDIKTLYNNYKSSIQFPKKDINLFEASIKAHISYGGIIKCINNSAILIIDGRVTDVYAPNESEALNAAKSALNGKYKAIFPLSCSDVLNKHGIEYSKKCIAMGKDLRHTDLYINNLFN